MKKKRVRLWLYFANEDLETAKLTLKERIYNQSCFHSHQCAEKSLKALIENKTTVPKVHSLFELFKVCKDLGYKLNTQKKIEFLNKFYTFTRYPMFSSLQNKTPSKKTAEKCIKFSEEIFSLAKKILGE